MYLREIVKCEIQAYRRDLIMQPSLNMRIITYKLKNRIEYYRITLITIIFNSYENGNTLDFYANKVAGKYYLVFFKGADTGNDYTLVIIKEKLFINSN